MVWLLCHLTWTCGLFPRRSSFQRFDTNRVVARIFPVWLRHSRTCEGVEIPVFESLTPANPGNGQRIRCLWARGRKRTLGDGGTCKHLTCPGGVLGLQRGDISHPPGGLLVRAILESIKDPTLGLPHSLKLLFAACALEVIHRITLALFLDL